MNLRSVSEADFYRRSRDMSNGYGVISLEALRWLNDIGAAFVAVDGDGDVIAAAGPYGIDDARLRRAQAAASSNGVGLAIARDLIVRKLKGQMDALGWFQNPPSPLLEIKIALAKARKAETLDELRFAEGEGARAYWSAWRELAVRFKRGDLPRIPEHWLSFGSRSSSLSRPSPRRAVNPPNALLNYVYAIVEAEARIASIAVGLDPAIGIMHSDLRARDSLPCDLMEAIRPQADEYVLDLIKNREFHKNDFFETRKGICRIPPPLHYEIAQTASQWKTLIGPIAEHCAEILFKQIASGANRTTLTPPTINRLPAPLTGINRATAKFIPIQLINDKSLKCRQKYTKRASLKLDCITCARQIDGRHLTYCNACLAR